MPDLSVNYMGMKLANPVIVASSTHTIDPENVRKLAADGVGAVVLKSIFEEQIRAEMKDVYAALERDMHPEAAEYLRADLPMRIGPSKYLERVAEIKRVAGIPVIASINCTAADKWVSFAGSVAAAGADALEINVYDIPDDAATTGAVIEERHLALVKAVRAEIGIPLAVKIGPFYSSITNFVRRLSLAGADAVVMFNRFFQPDIDVDRLALKGEIGRSTAADIRLPLRWIALVRRHVSCALSLTTGVHDAEGVVKALLAGADTAQICSVLYRDGNAVPGIVSGVAHWMERNGFSSVADFRGRLASDDAGNGFDRAQYMKSFVGLE